MTIKVRLSPKSKIKVRTRIVVPGSINGLANIDLDNIKDGYILMYDGNLQQFVFVDPDKVLSKSVQDNILPSDFINQLDIDLDNRIDNDGGSF